MVGHQDDTDPSAAKEISAVSDPGEFFGEPIHIYSRAQAIDDGVLVDVTDAARAAGFKVPVALTRAVWEDCVAWQDVNVYKPPQDEAGRLWDVLWMAYLAAHRAGDSSRVTYEIVRVPATGQAIHAAKVQLAMAIGGGDNGEPVITIMQPGED